MLTTYIFILIFGTGATTLEVNSHQECLELMEDINKTLKKDSLTDKAATGCFRNLGIRTNRS